MVLGTGVSVVFVVLNVILCIFTVGKVRQAKSRRRSRDSRVNAPNRYCVMTISMICVQPCYTYVVWEITLNNNNGNNINKKIATVN